MELEFNNKTYKFVFGLGFLKAVNRANKINANGLQLNAGLEAIAANLMNGDIETLITVLRTANETEAPRMNEKAIAGYIEENGADDLFDEVFDELKKSEFTKKKVEKIMDEADKAK